MRWECDNMIDRMFIEARESIKNNIKMLSIQAESRLFPKTKRDTCKKIKSELIYDFLKKRGYVSNYLLGKKIMTKGFTCVYVVDDYVEVWHDKTNNDKSVFVKESLLTGLPITLNYMERI